MATTTQQIVPPEIVEILGEDKTAIEAFDMAMVKRAELMLERGGLTDYHLGCVLFTSNLLAVTHPVPKITGSLSADWWRQAIEQAVGNDPRRIIALRP